MCQDMLSRWCPQLSIILFLALGSISSQWDHSQGFKGYLGFSQGRKAALLTTSLLSSVRVLTHPTPTLFLPYPTVQLPPALPQLTLGVWSQTVDRQEQPPPCKLSSRSTNFLVPRLLSIFSWRWNSKHRDVNWHISEGQSLSLLWFPREDCGSSFYTEPSRCCFHYCDWLPGPCFTLYTAGVLQDTGSSLSCNICSLGSTET